MAAKMMDFGDCNFEDRPIRISDSASIHLRAFDIDPYTLCDMLADTIDCPKLKKTGKAFRKSSKRVCSRRDGKTYNIILDEYSYKDRMMWTVSHLEPI